MAEVFKMGKIKFRGKRLANGEWVYGDLMQFKGKPAIISSAGELIYFAVTKQGLRGIAEVEPESVAQLVGYDADGKEVYEGDVLVNDSGGEFQASFKSVITGLKNPCYCRYLENLKHRKYYRLKE